MKISSWQLLILLFLSRIFIAITYFTLEDISPSVMMSTSAISVATDMVLVIPAIFLYKNYPDENVIISAFKVSKIFGIILTVLYFIFAVFMIFRTVRFFLYFFENAFSNLLPTLVVGVMLIAAAAYVAHLGIEAAARSSSIVFAVFILLLIAVVATTAEDFDITNYYVEHIDTNDVFGGIVSGLSRSSEIVVLVLVLPYLKTGITKSVYGFLLLKLLFVEMIILLCMLFLGGYMEAVQFPFFTVCSFAKAPFVDRLDAIFLVVWTLIGVIKLSLFTISLRPASVLLKPLQNSAVTNLVPFVLGGAPALYFAYKEQMIIPLLDNELTAAAIVLLGTVIPLVVLILRRFKREKN